MYSSLILLPLHVGSASKGLWGFYAKPLSLKVFANETMHEKVDHGLLGCPKVDFALD